VRARRAPGRSVGTALGHGLVAVVTAALALGVLAGPASAAPRRPSDTQVQQAQAAADAAAAQVSALSAELAGAQASVDKAQAASAIALDDYQAKQAQFQAAQTAADQAAAAAAQAAADLQTSHDELVAFARRSFMSHSTYAGAAALVTSGSPSELIERAALLDAAGAHRTDQVASFTAARQQADQADAAAQTSLSQAGALQQQASDALTVAQDAERAARQQATDVQAQQADLQQQLDQAQAQLVALVGQQQAADRLAAQQQAAAPKPATTSNADPVVRTEAGPGSASAAQAAIDAAMTQLGVRYSWGGGGTNGPSYGIDLDANVVGYDCSGLTQYAYAQAGIAIPRNSRSQFSDLPKVAKADLQPGDLVFWANDPSDPSTIHHVAIYLGGKKVIQAPESGDVVKVSDMWWSGYAGAVRPSA
jgi:cell wall-associated NlpC family hydrolase